MFKSKYGLIGVVLVLVFGAISVFWVRSSVEKKIGVEASQRLNQADFLMRQVERANRGVTIELANKGTLFIADQFLAYRAAQDKLNGIMQKNLQALASQGEVPLFVAVVGNPSGVKQHMGIHWMAVNGTVVTDKVRDQWLSAELLNGLKGTKKRAFKAAAVVAPAPKKGKKGAKDNKPAAPAAQEIKIPLFVGETPGKYHVKPAIYKQILMDGVKIPLGVKVVKNFKKVKGDTYTPVFEGAVIMGFASTPLDKAAKLVLRAGRDRGLVDVLAKLTTLKKSMFALSTKLFNSPSFTIEGRKPHIAVLTNASGVVITRDRDDSKLSGYNYLKNNIGRMGIIGEAVKRKNAIYDVLTYEVINRYRKKDKPASLHQAASVPIRGQDGKILGVFTMAWPFDVRLSQVGKMSSISFGYFYGNHTVLSSFKGTKEIKELHSTFKGRFGSVKTSPYVLTKKDAKGALVKGDNFSIAGGSFLGAYFKNQENTLDGENYGYIVLVDKGQLKKPFKGIIPLIIGFGVFVILLILVLEYMVFFYFYKAIDSIDEGIQEVAAGDMDFVFGRVSNETEGLANSLNEMLNVIFGRESIDEESGEAPMKQGIQLISMGKLPEMPLLGDDPKVAKLDGMTDSEFHTYLYGEFKKAWEELGEEDPVPSLDLFLQRVKLYERMVLRQMECGRVLFAIQTTDEGILLVPLPIS